MVRDSCVWIGRSAGQFLGELKRGNRMQASHGLLVITRFKVEGDQMVRRDSISHQLLRVARIPAGADKEGVVSFGKHWKRLVHAFRVNPGMFAT